MIIKNKILKRVEPSDIVDGTVNIPSYVEKIETLAFKELDALEYINLMQHIKYVGMHTFLYCKHLKSVMFFNDNCKIGAGLFAGCEELRVVRFPQNLKQIKPLTFFGCTDLQVDCMPDKITDIGKGAYQDCTSLEKIVIPSGVNEIQINQFQGCKNLKTIIFKGKNYTYDDLCEYGRFT